MSESKLMVTMQAKRNAKMALEERKKLGKTMKFGLSSKQARREGVESGVERGKQIVRSKSLDFEDAKSVAGFYQRFKNCRSKKCEGALNLWGGRSFGKKAVTWVKAHKRKGKDIKKHKRRLS